VKIESTLDETGPLWIDPHRIGQAVDNLLTNAIKFSDAGTVVHVRLNAEGETATIEVEDEGMGVSPEELKRLFDRLFRTRSAVESQIQGTGLGLTIVKSVVEAHEGSVSVRSVEGQGTTFSIELPVQRPPKAEMSLAASGEENQ
jgi:signal transduction histidine kinase